MTSGGTKFNVGLSLEEHWEPFFFNELHARKQNLLVYGYHTSLQGDSFPIFCIYSYFLSQ